MVTDEESWLAAVEKTGWAPLPDGRRVAARPAVELVEARRRGARRDAGRPGRQGVPHLVAQRVRGPRDVHLHPLPAPGILSADGRVLRDRPEGAWPDGRLRGPVRLLSVSFDPDFDTPAVLEGPRRAASAPTRASGRSPPRRADRVEAWGARLGLSVIRDAKIASDLTHNLRTAVIDRQGRLVTDPGRQPLDAWTRPSRRLPRGSVRDADGGRMKRRRPIPSFGTGRHSFFSHDNGQPGR